MNIVFRVDASLHSGTGHVMRCLVLAEELSKAGYKVTFSMRPQNGDLVDLVKLRGFSISKLGLPSSWKVPAHDADYKAWLHVSEEEDAEDFCRTNNNVDAVIVDHYALGVVWESKVRLVLNCKMIVIDDLLRSHECDFLLDQSLGRKFGDYRDQLQSTALQYMGTEYALLSPYFAKERSRLERSGKLQAKPKLLVCMGGVDSSNITLPVIEQVVRYGIDKFSKVTVVMSPKSPSYTDVLKLVIKYSEVMCQLDFIENMALAMAEHDLAVGAPGATSWERACLGLPSVIISLAENQNNVCQQLVDHSVAIEVKRHDLDKSFAAAVDKLLGNMTEYANNCLRICDGLGVYRVCYHIKRVLAQDSQYFSRCRLATASDIEIVYSWQNMPATRRYSLIKDVPSWEEHLRWMTLKLSSPRDYFYIIEVNSKNGEKKAVGVVRLDEQKSNEFLISIYVIPEYHGEGVATEALSFVDAVHRDVVINAIVLAGNTASQRLFSKAGYQKIGPEHFQRTTIQS